MTDPVFWALIWSNLIWPDLLFISKRICYFYKSKTLVSSSLLSQWEVSWMSFNASKQSKIFSTMIQWWNIAMGRWPCPDTVKTLSLALVRKEEKGDARLYSHLIPFPVMVTKTAGRKKEGREGQGRALLILVLLCCSRRKFSEEVWGDQKEVKSLQFHNFSYVALIVYFL